MNKKRALSAFMHTPAGKQYLTRTLLNTLTGRMEDLVSLEKHLDHVEGIPGIEEFFTSLVAGAKNAAGTALLFQRLGRALSLRSKQKLIENLIYNWAIAGEHTRRKFRSRNIHVPRFIVISPSMRCNLNCTGCYSGLYHKQKELKEVEIRRILDQSRDFGGYFVVVSGGEPFVHTERWLNLFKHYHDMFFLVYTNGTLITDPVAERIASLGNVACAVSLEGWEEQTDARRGAGVYRKAISAVKRLSEAGAIAGTSITYTRDTIDTTVSEEFVKHLIDIGAVFSWYFMFMPVGKDPILELVPTPEQRYTAGNTLAEIRRNHPIFLADFWNDGPAAGGCLAAGRVYLHILHDGRIEPCVFAHFGEENIRDTSIIEAVQSPFFTQIRDSFPYNSIGNLKRPCMIIDNPEVLRHAVHEHIVHPGHPSGEDLIDDEEITTWIDRYAHSYAQITDPIWLEMINNPDSPWYKHKKKYQQLFSKRENCLLHT